MSARRTELAARRRTHFVGFAGSLQLAMWAFFPNASQRWLCFWAGHDWLTVFEPELPYDRDYCRICHRENRIL